METSATESLAGFVANLTYDEIPTSTRQFVKDLLLDSVSCALASERGDEVTSVAAYARALGGLGQSTIIGGQEQLSLLGASLLNAYLITAVTVCDVYTPAHVHVTPEVVPPVLGVAEREASSGRDIIVALAAGLETTVRVADGLNYEAARPLGWHMPGIVGPFGAAAGVAHLLRLDHLQVRNALGLAGSQSAGTWASWGTPAVKFHQARGAVSGLMAGLLAKRDFLSSADILEHEDGGLFSSYSDGAKPDAVTEEIGSRWKLEEISLRLWPGGTPLQPGLTALFEYVDRYATPIADVARVKMFVAPRVYDAHARFVEPQGSFDALLSFNFAAGMVLGEGSFWLDCLADVRYREPQMREFMRDRFELVADPSFGPDSCRLEVTDESGSTETVTIDAAKGHPGNPLTPADLESKFRRCADGQHKSTRAEELLDALTNLEQVDDTTALFGLLAGERPAGDR